MATSRERLALREELMGFDPLIQFEEEDVSEDEEIVEETPNIVKPQRKIVSPNDGYFWGSKTGTIPTDKKMSIAESSQEELEKKPSQGSKLVVPGEHKVL